MILEHADIIVTRRLLIIHQHQKYWVDSRMLVVMHSGWYEAAHLLEVVHFEQFFHFTIHTEVVERLTDICCMSLIVVGDALVAHGQSSDEVDQVAEF